jgi:methylase of polypeptide subunit release factors
LNLSSDDEKFLINAFDWQQAFAWLAHAGGFDAVIGNPPYVRMETFKPIRTWAKIT